ncbi:hypothetical protein COV53_01205 [Candidatus Gottesmanbacteria bacterium CG11_big_fil_rev_8_21_14_0_20_37_11]|uniref:DUF5673 domain-containing protein n=3 Tax=Candidatus Gottesmaniibacteriota TaxID=1752720 RepID=A0A2M7RQT0_9BACT|nr:MAG: hypothetical protein AUJ73_02730 [Candidatus Gottesmanbacteria bacterium CG1_02_37_22]PIP32334.1 MAG: hypothetical protein COX23_05365 [Candidatus Gottesmanbacteria bacterium CG23_combo_of_CG06-09_8_20_14_all_37_19]PIR08775.1 MAG: hypothetical protein COV53_01205 [Candidatus Gottesmanbacteria bacterium CG11_big_fil_rev_8_21_14_0_20_37_11]PIZ02435.1 MAG: hypothetical protein COY59_04765 [Candidatus Gottesmanbacteria bacterium CG_4_10_14_0_8_um_filter_37_24]
MTDTRPESDMLKNQPDLNEILLTWKSPSHPYKKRNRVFYQTVAAITFLLVAIVFFMNDFLLIGVILSVAFVVYATSTIPPVEVKHKITPIGFENAGRLFKWIELYSFWFEEKWNHKVLIIQTRLPFPPQIRMVINNDIEKNVKEVIGKYLLFQEKPTRSFVDSLSHWFSQKIPLDTVN